MSIPHIPVLLEEVSKAFRECETGTIVDCTTGFAGHSNRLLDDHKDIKLVCIDQDEEALGFSKNRLKEYSERVTFIKSDFANGILKVEADDIKGVLADIGVSSFQLDEDSRGFGFNSDVLDMRMDKRKDLTAYEVVNNYSKEDLERIIKEYGEDSYYKKIASLIAQNRPIQSAKELSSLMEKNFKRGKIHPATKLFQGIRIEVNSELEQIETLLRNIESIASKDLTVAVISFHSLEDRIVKNIFKEWSRKCICPPGTPRCRCGNNNQKGKVITKKPIIPISEEIKANPRSRSSKMRIFKFE